MRREVGLRHRISRELGEEEGLTQNIGATSLKLRLKFCNSSEMRRNESLARRIVREFTSNCGEEN